MSNILLHELKLVNFRNFTELSIAFDQNITFIVGENGAGKTSILEALNVLATGKSFRVATHNKIIRNGADFLRVELHFAGSEIKYSRDCVGNRKIMFDGILQTNFLNISKHLPLFIMEGDFFRAFHLGSLYRQKIINWTMFHVEHSFAELWQVYNRVLCQRNALLKQSVSYQELLVWDKVLAETGEKITKIRAEVVAALYPLFMQICQQFDINVQQLKLEFVKGWGDLQNLLSSLKNNYLKDKARGYSGIGPHRFDVNFTKNGVLVRDMLSRGQQKAILLAWGLACAQYLYIKQGIKCVFLLDDLGSELDFRALNNAINYLATNHHQVVITSLSLHGLKNDDRCKNQIVSLEIA